MMNILMVIIVAQSVIIAAAVRKAWKAGAK